MLKVQIAQHELTGEQLVYGQSDRGLNGKGPDQEKIVNDRIDTRPNAWRRKRKGQNGRRRSGHKPLSFNHMMLNVTIIQPKPSVYLILYSEKDRFEIIGLTCKNSQEEYPSDTPPPKHVCIHTIDIHISPTDIHFLSRSYLIKFLSCTCHSPVLIKYINVTRYSKQKVPQDPCYMLLIWYSYTNSSLIKSSGSGILSLLVVKAKLRI